MSLHAVVAFTLMPSRAERYGAALVPVRNTKQTIYRRDKDLTWLCVLQALVWGSVRGQLVALRSKVSKGGWVEGNVLVFVAHAAARVRGQVFRAHL